MALAALAVAAGASAGGPIRVHATISYTKRDGVIQRARLRIARGGALRLSTEVGRLANGRADLLGLRVRDLDGDGEPEVVLDLYTRGAHCCWESVVYRYAAGGYRPGLHRWGNVSYRLTDLDGDGRPELRSADDRFAYVFTSFATSYFPLRVWHYRHGRFVDVTRRFPGAVRADAARLWTRYLHERAQHAEVRGVLAAWLADEYRLGRERVGWARRDAALRRGDLGPRPDLDGWPQARAYLAALRRFLGREGYR